MAQATGSSVSRCCSLPPRNGPSPRAGRISQKKGRKTERIELGSGQRELCLMNKHRSSPGNSSNDEARAKARQKAGCICDTGGSGGSACPVSNRNRPGRSHTGNDAGVYLHGRESQVFSFRYTRKCVGVAGRGTRGRELAESGEAGGARMSRMRGRPDQHKAQTPYAVPAGPEADAKVHRLPTARVWRIKNIPCRDTRAWRQAGHKKPRFRAFSEQKNTAHLKLGICQRLGKGRRGR